jgi:hypothetical protein
MKMYVMPEDQGQIVTVSYGCDGEYLYCRTLDTSDRSESWQRAEIEWSDDNEFEPWNGRLPKVHDDEWEPCSAPKEAAR